MPRKRYKPEEIVTKLRQVDVLLSQGSSVADAIRQIAVRLAVYHRPRHLQYEIRWWTQCGSGCHPVCGQPIHASAVWE